MIAMGLLVFAVVAPGLFTGAFISPGRHIDRIRTLASWAALPALVLALAPISYDSLDLPWLLLGARFELDLIGRFFLILAATLWTCAGVFARAYVPDGEQNRFFVYFLLTMSGNLALPFAADAATFYFGFALMTFAGYGLVVHTGSRPAIRAGRVYIILAVIGEGFLLAGLLVAAQAAGSLSIEAIPPAVAASSSAGLLTGLLLIGFGIKAGAVPLHMWLPLAHPVAPTPASAVLSGSMIKAGLLGWLRFLPLGDLAQPGWGVFVIGLGIGAAFFGVVIGLMQTDPKTVLAYSSVSQMGVVNVGVGTALAAPEAAAEAIGAVMTYALHHGLAKGALFLSVGVVAARLPGGLARAALAVGIFLPALAVAGAPLTSGSVAKGELKALLPFTPGPWPTWLEWLLPLSAFATTLIMARFLFLLAAGYHEHEDRALARGIWLPWAALVGAVAVALWLLPRWYPIGLPDTQPDGIGPGGLEILPLVAAGLIVWLTISLSRRQEISIPLPTIEPGDILNPIERILRAVPRPTFLHQGRDPALLLAMRWYQVYARSDRQDVVLRIEMLITRWAPAILFLVAIMAALLLLMARWT
jgi:formate hydrogenlyase subunit 3/multisubunit Na+/H+ antiporter MnhD subunit